MFKKLKEEVEGKVEGTHRSFEDSKEEVEGITGSSNTD